MLKTSGPFATHGRCIPFRLAEKDKDIRAFYIEYALGLREGISLMVMPHFHGNWLFSRDLKSESPTFIF
jgi:hypothetical protein